MRFLPLITFLFLIACSTPYDLKKTDPKITYVTSKPANDVKKCILDKWRLHLTNVHEEEISEGYMVRFNDTLENATVAIVTIESMGPEVNVNYYHRTNRIKLERLEEEVKACK
ncbi:MAG TPA: hypothetical protein VNJ08_01455 [Bacteriovoracaceae bacterium]|nr:hypothetical protein [Bacteriovoracaceae bacterium]